MKNYILIIATILINTIIIAQQVNQTKLLQPKDSLEVRISCDKTEFIQGEPIDIFVKIKNRTGRTIRTGRSKHYLYDLSKDSIFANYDDAIIDIPPFGNYFYFVDPVDWVIFGGIEFSTHTLSPGNYEYSLSWFIGTDEFSSDKIFLKINPVSDTLQQAYNDLRFDPKKYDPNKNYLKESETNVEKYKGTFYEQNFYNKLLSYPTFYNAIQNKVNDKEFRTKALKLYKEFIIKYCNTGNGYSKFKWMMYDFDDNYVVVEEIIISLKKNKPDCKLLKVLRNQPEYINKDIEYLLN